jgi:hypothetical protein
MIYSEADEEVVVVEDGDEFPESLLQKSVIISGK